MSTALKQCINLLQSGESPRAELIGDAISEMLSGDERYHHQVAALLALLNPSLFTPQIIAEAAKALRRHGTPFPQLPEHCRRTLDIVGTGGDGLDTFNVSTAASFIVAGSGVPIVKVGNRSASSMCGSADLLEALGATIDLDLHVSAKVCEQVGFAFLFAQKCYPGMRHISSIRKQLAIKTIFNVLGPLTNPCTPEYQLTGVYDRQLGLLFAQTFQELGIKRAMVVHSDEGMDEISPAGNSHIWFLHGGVIEELDVTPEDFGLPRHQLAEVASGTPAQNAEKLRRMLSGVESAELDHVLMNCAAALVVAEKASDFKNGVEVARQSIKSGCALTVLNNYIEATHNLVPKQTILQTIAANRRLLVAHAKATLSYDDLLFSAVRSPGPTRIDILERLNSDGPMCLIAEIKRASPSLGDINANIDPVEQALRYARGGASAISVLCEPKWFKGSLDDLRDIRFAIEQLPNRPAILLKDFVEDEYQLVEGRLAGADSALLIVALLDEHRLRRLIYIARSLGMEPLVEVANEKEMDLALSLGARLVGINNRNLHTFMVDTTTTIRLSTLFHQRYKGEASLPIDKRPLLAALSGIKTHADVELYANAGAGAVLVGETLMKTSDPADAISELLGRTNPLALPATPRPSQPLVKICGIRTPADAVNAARVGADLIGIIFVQKSKRFVSPMNAKRIVDALHGADGHVIDFSDEMPAKCRTKLDAPLWFNSQAISLMHAVERARAEQSRPLVVGVFQNHTINEMNSIANQVGLDLIQLHGDEGYEIACHLVRPVIRSISVDTSEANVERLVAAIEPGSVKAILLDTKSALGGGSGHTFDWSIAREVQHLHKIPIILAGGLTPQNVTDAVKLVHPLGVDVASGVENTDSSGCLLKNQLALMQFVTCAKTCL